MIAAVALGGLVGADRTAFGQTSLADPLLAAILAGLLTGDAAAGLAVGIPLTLFALAAPPIGNPRPLDWSSGAVVGGAWAGITPGPEGTGAALLLALAFAWVGSVSIQGIRGVAQRWLGEPERVLSAGGLAEVRRRHLALAGLHLVRGAAVVALGILLGEPWMDLVERAPVPERAALGWLAATAPLLALPTLLRAAAQGVARGWVMVGCALAFAGLVLGRLA